MNDDSRTRVRKRRLWRLPIHFGIVLLIVAAASMLYLNQIGLPGFAKRSLQARLATQGLKLDFDWLRVGWNGALRAARMQLDQADDAGRLSVIVGSGVILPNYAAFLSGRSILREFSLSGIQLEAQLNDGGTQLPPVKVHFPNGEVSLAGSGTLNVENLKGNFMGISLDAAFKVSNALAPFANRKPRVKPLTAEAIAEKLRPFKIRLAVLAKRRESLTFRNWPEVELRLEGDAKRFDELRGSVGLQAGGMTLPAGSLDEFSAQFNLGPSNGITGSVRFSGLNTEAVKIGMGTAEVYAMQLFTNAVPDSVDFSLSLGQLATAKASAQSVKFSGNLARAGSSPETDDRWAYWAGLSPYEADFSGLVNGITGEKGLAISEVAFAGEWRSPLLALSRLDAKLYDGSVSGSAELDVATRLAKVDGRVAFSLHRMFDLLTPKAQRWLNQYQWSEAPVVTGTAQALMPEWTNTKPDWRVEVRPTLSLNGRVISGPIRFRGIEIGSVQSRLVYSNLTWRLPNLVARRPEGEVLLSLRSHTETQDYQIEFLSSIDPQAVIPALEKDEQKKGFGYFSFDKPPVIEGRIWGRWREREKTGFRAMVAATNFTYRAQQVDSFTVGISFVNGFLTMTNALLKRPEGEANAEAIGFDSQTKRLYLTNAVGRLEPMAVARAIGSKTADAIEPYRFLEPPLARVNGWVQTGPGRNPANLHFAVDGGPFRFSRFHSRDINGEVFWRGQNMVLTNIVAEFYGGEMRGNLVSRFNLDRTAELAFDLDTQQTELTGLMTDILGKPSELSGILEGSLDISAHSNDWDSWNGTASATLKDGYLWELPIIGIFAPVLDRLTPGLGASTFSEGKADFTIADSLVTSRNLELKSALLSLQYKGVVDFEGHIRKGGVVAEALRDTWVIGPVLGPIFNLALSPIERMLKFDLSGTLNRPKFELKHIPKALLVPFKLPFKVIDELAPGAEPEGRGP